MKLPIGLSVPHAGLGIPDCVVPYNQLTDDEIAADGDVGARGIYRLSAHVAEFVTTGVARAFLGVGSMSLFANVWAKRALWFLIAWPAPAIVAAQLTLAAVMFIAGTVVMAVVARFTYDLKRRTAGMARRGWSGSISRGCT